MYILNFFLFKVRFLYFYFLKQFIEEVQTLRESETRLRQQHADSQRRERILARRLAAKEQEMQDYAVSCCFYSRNNKFLFFIHKLGTTHLL